MAGPGGRPVGRVSVRVAPDTSSFAASLQAYLERVERRLSVELPVSLSAPDVARTEAQLATLARDRRVNLDVNTAPLERVSEMLNKLNQQGRRGGIGFLSPTVLAGIAAAVGALGAALPGLLASIGAPLAAIAIGFKGIARAASVMALPFRVMQTAVSNVFERGLLPVFAKLNGVLPTLGVGFAAIANSIVAIADAVATKLSSPQGLTMLGQIFTNIATALTTLAPSMGVFVDSFLKLAVVGTAAFVKLAPAIAKFVTDFAAFLGFLERTGMLKLAMEGLGIAILFVIGVFAGLVSIGLVVGGILGGLAALVRAAGQGIAAAISGIVAVFRGLPGRIRGGLAAMGAAIASSFQKAMRAGRQAVVSGIDRIVEVARTIKQRVKNAVGNLKDVLVEAGKDIIRGLIRGIEKMFRPLGTALGKVGGFIQRHKGPPSKDRVLLEPAGRLIMQGLMNGMQSEFGSIESTLDRFTNRLATPPTSFLPGDGAALEPFPTAATAGGAKPEDIRKALEGMRMVIGRDGRTLQLTKARG